MIDKMQIEKEPGVLDIKDILHAAEKKYNKPKLHFLNFLFLYTTF